MNQNQSATPEQRAAQLEQYAGRLESVNREIKAINVGLTDRCGQLAAERDVQASDANQLRSIVQNQAQDISAKEEQIRALIADLAAASQAKTIPSSDDDRPNPSPV